MILIISYYTTIICHVSNILNPSIIEIKIISIESGGGGGRQQQEGGASICIGFAFLCNDFSTT